NSVRSYLKQVTGFRSIHITEASKNKGLANSIIEGVTDIINHHGKIIVLEDDLLSSSNFLVYMNKALEYYSDNDKIFSVSGFSMPVKGLCEDDIYFTGRSSSWGWATWKQQWNKVDWEVKDYPQFNQDRFAKQAFNKMGSDMSQMLRKQIQGKINSWAIRWCYYQFKHQLFTVYPAISKIRNIGLEDARATHTNERFSRFKTTIDISENTTFNFTDKVTLDKNIIKQFVKPYSYPQRIKYKVLNTFPVFSLLRQINT
ncbi:MAG: sugar transferase, partial [Bacteroidota bacterium]